MKKIALFIILGAMSLLSACGNSPIIYSQNDFLRTFNIRLEEESLNNYMLINLDSKKDQANNITLTGFNRTQDLQVELVFDALGNLTRFGLLTNRIPDEDLTKLLTIIRETFPSQQKYTVKEGVSPNTGYRGIGFFLNTNKKGEEE
ncbi:MAG: hypothetical protein LBH40_04095 [Alphaproteobacteria bacterium]|jgi:hypothetical protein|nr:hypothetical protein [Alphaproteobacteria bacterium]